MNSNSIQRCPWVNLKNSNYVHYHDTEWGRPSFDESYLFAMLNLEGAQAGLSWETVLNRRANYMKIFKGFDPHYCAKLKDSDLDELMKDPGIIRNRLKLKAVRQNSLAYLSLVEEFGSLTDYLWSHVNYQPLVLRPESIKEFQVTNELSDYLAKDLKQRGFTFVGSTIIYAFLQAVGIINEHSKNCFIGTAIS